MRPDLIITDELSHLDTPALQHAVIAGVTVLASAHCATFDSIPADFLKIFERFVFLNNQKIGEISAIYDKQGEKIV